MNIYENIMLILQIQVVHSFSSTNVSSVAVQHPNVQASQHWDKVRERLWVGLRDNNMSHFTHTMAAFKFKQQHNISLTLT